MVMCWHMRKHTVKKIESIVDKSEQENLVNDRKPFQLAQSEQIFLKASNLFIKKWMKKQPIFKNDFQNEWLTNLKELYEGVGHFKPNTNNVLESTSNLVKNEITLRQRLPLSRFKVLACENSKDGRNLMNEV